MKDNGQCFVLMLPEKPELAGYHWTCYLFSEVTVEKSRISKQVYLQAPYSIYI